MNTQAKRERSKPEMNNGKTTVETAGYIPKDKKIRSLIMAGMKLEAMRKSGNYDFAPDSPVDEESDIPPNRLQNFDLADASNIIKRGQQAKIRIREKLKKDYDEVKSKAEAVQRDPQKVVDENDKKE